MSSHETVDGAFQIIGEAISLEPDTFHDDETWKFLGLIGLLASATAADIRSQLNIDFPDDAFTKYPNVGTLKGLLSGNSAGAELSRPSIVAEKEPADPWENVPKPKAPLSMVLQGKPETASKIVFLFPDGSGAGGAYGTLPEIGSGVCLIGLNSPFLRQAQHYNSISIERMAKLWYEEVRRLQPAGQPYTLGGWSAGGFYAFEISRLLIAAGEKVEKMILIDSPCRWNYEALPGQVVQELTKKGLMGASGDRKAPDWLVQHFASTVVAVDRYWPDPLPQAHVPAKVHFIWVREGLVKSVPDSGLDVDMNVRVTRFLLEPRGDLKSEGWEKLLPGAQYTYDYMTGNHFTITQPPHVNSLGDLIRKVVAS